MRQSVKKAVIFFMELQNCILNGGVAWVKLITSALDQIDHSLIDERVKTEILNSKTYTERLWFLLICLLVLEIEIELPDDPYADYMLQHGYAYMYKVFFDVGDVYRYMYTLETRMQQYHDMIRAAARTTDDRNAHH